MTSCRHTSFLAPGRKVSSFSLRRDAWARRRFVQCHGWLRRVEGRLVGRSLVPPPPVSIGGKVVFETNSCLVRRQGIEEAQASMLSGGMHYDPGPPTIHGEDLTPEVVISEQQAGGLGYTRTL